MVYAAKGLAFVAQEVLSGRLDPRSANATTAAINGLVAVLRETEIERRLEALERAAGVTQ